MKDKIEIEADLEKPQLFYNSNNILYFTKKSPFKNSCNEDALAVFHLDGGVVMAVADGAGGHPKGEEAAALVLKNIKKCLKSDTISKDNIRRYIVDAIEITHKELMNNGIGARTTVTICEVFDNRARCYQVGDSGVVICGQKGKLKYRATQHSPVGYGIEAGLIDDKEALQHPDLHFISNLVGESGMKIEIGPEVELNPNDSIFLASDGIFDNFPPDEIIELVRKGDLQQISSELMTLITHKIYANENAKKDDISFILFKNLQAG